MIGSNIEIKL